MQGDRIIDLPLKRIENWSALIKTTRNTVHNSATEQAEVHIYVGDLWMKLKLPRKSGKKCFEVWFLRRKQDKLIRIWYPAGRASELDKWGRKIPIREA